MCELCSGALGRQEASEMANRLRRLASDYERLSTGSMKPHTEDTKRVAERAKTIVRRLVEEWV